MVHGSIALRPRPSKPSGSIDCNIRMSATGKPTLTSTPSHAARIPQLDGLRAVAVLLVFLVHTFPNRMPGGHIGVDIFFVLSGYLITTILLRERDRTGAISIKSFYLRRTLRLFPALAVLLLIYVSIIPLIWGHDHILAAASSLYVMNWVRALDLGPTSFLGHTWSLAIEEQFYLVWPILLIGILHFGRHLLRPILCALIILIVVWRIYLLKHGASINRLYNGFDTRSDGLLIGCLLGCTPAFVSVAARFWPAGAAILIAEALSLKPTGLLLPAGLFTLTAIAAAAIISALVTSKTNRLQCVLRFRPLVALGEFSYGFYLWHYVFIEIASNMPHPTRPIIAAFAMTLTLPVAWASFRYIEKPILDLGVPTRLKLNSS
jgi:peptidoglycan/LPS O-acetylase OafA/YrhL